MSRILLKNRRSRPKTWRGAGCSAWRHPRRLWEPQAAPLHRNQISDGFSAECYSLSSMGRSQFPFLAPPGGQLVVQMIELLLQALHIEVECRSHI
jgi:hypothetical protein